MLESEDVTDLQDDAQEAPIMKNTVSKQESEKEDSFSDKDCDGCSAAASEDEIVDQTVPPSQMKNQSY